MPRGIAWFIIAVKEIGIPAVVIGALLYICFISQRDMTTALSNVTVLMARLSEHDATIIENQHLILQRLK